MPAKKRFKAQITVPLPVDVKDRLEEMAYKRGTTTAQICREALGQYLGKSEGKYDQPTNQPIAA